MKTKVIIFLFLLLVSVKAIAECSGVSCSGVKVLKMQVNASGVIWVQTTGTETNLSCTPDSGLFLKFDGTTPGGKNVYSSLLAYKMADKPLGFRIIENTNPCELSYVVTD